MKGFPLNLETLQYLIVDALEDVKAQDIQVFNTTPMTALFDRVIVASGTSNRQTRALAKSVHDKVKENGGDVYGMEGEDTGEWVLVDCGDVVVHILQPTIREYYRLEDIWGEHPIALDAVTQPFRKKAPARKPTARKPITGTPPVEAKPAAKKPAAKKSASKEPAVKKPAAKKPAAKKPAAKKPSAKAPAAKKPAAKKPAAKKPASKEPAAKKPAAKKPAAKKPAGKKPAPPRPTTKRPLV
ncbi:MAG: Ribosomal silencing factor RsfS [Pseudomonadota bacterium]